MPKHKSSKKPDTSDSDSGPEDRVPASKKAKPSGDAGEDSWGLGKNRFVKLSEFKGKWYVDIREYYDADGELKPTKKGIMLTMEQWQKFNSSVDGLNEAIKRKV